MPFHLSGRQFFPGRWFAGLLLGVLMAFWGPAAGASEGLPWERGADASLELLDLGPLARIVPDPDGGLTTTDLLSRPGADRFTRGMSMNRLSPDNAAHWLIVPLNNPTSSPVTRLLVFEPAWTEAVRVVLAEPDGSMHEQRAGTQLPFSARAMPHRKINLRLHIPSGDSTLLVRVESPPHAFLFGMELWEPAAYFKHESGVSAHVFLMFGLMGCLLLIACVLFLIRRESVYGAYAAYLLLFLALTTISHGYADPFLWPDSGRMKSGFISALLYAQAAVGIYGALAFLDLRHTMPRVYRLGLGLIVAIALSPVIVSLFNGFEPNPGGMYWIIAMAPPVLWAGVRAWQKGSMAARFFVPAAGAGLTGSLVTVLTLRAWIPFSFVGEHAVNFGMGIAAILLAFELGRRIRVEPADSAKAEAESLLETQRYAEQLEVTVMQYMEELRNANAEKEKYFRIISHDLRGAMHGLSLVYNDLIRSSSDFNDEILAMTRKAVNEINQMLEQLVTWVRNQRGDIECLPRRLDIAGLIRETLGLYAANAAVKDIALKLDAEDACYVQADREMVRTILRNLIANALKFTPGNGCITASVMEREDDCVIRITDTGVGIDEGKQRMLFRADAMTHPGLKSPGATGLGLILCREFVEKHGGNIAVESRPGLGTSFTFTLPRSIEAAESVAC